MTAAGAVAMAATGPAPSALEAEGLVRRYRTAPTWHVWNRHQRTVVDGVSIKVQRGEVVGLLGPNGAGKTTTFNMVVGLLAPHAGRVRLDGKDVTRLPMHLRARAGVGYLPQEASIFRKLTVRDNFLAVLEMMPLSSADRDRVAGELLEEFGLNHVADSLGEMLSGGERRRAEIARSLIRSPSFILFDEPFAGIDPIAVHEIQRQVAALRSRGLGVLITDHNVRDTLSICDRAYVIADGRILEEGTPAKIAASPRARQVYLGERFKLEGEAANGGAPGVQE
ncbi:MAG TPA: LPS export ABC transporter ATP-binding protein [Myxococcales bacterium]|jgi:lipopolysaccharide export system ATP-binding protein